MHRARLCLASMVACAAIAAPASAQTPPPAPAPPAPEKRIAPGATAAGVDLSNLTIPEATARLDQQLGPLMRRTVSVRVGGHTMRMTMRSVSLRFDAERTAKRAYYAGRDAAAAQPPVPPAPVPLAVRFRKHEVRDFVERVDDRVRIAPRNAYVRITLRRMLERPEKTGRDLDGGALRTAIEAVLADPAADRVLRPGRRVTRAKVTGKELPSAYPTVVTVDRRNFRLRLFKRLKLVKSYGIAVGAAGYDTPTGLYSITNKAVNPAWSAPDRPWAGLYRGRTVAGGAPDNPLKARWLGIVNGVGIHGTGDPGSIGSRASHGCIRMRVPDVIDLYDRVPVGTPVLIK